MAVAEAAALFPVHRLQAEGCCVQAAANLPEHRAGVVGLLLVLLLGLAASLLSALVAGARTLLLALAPGAEL